MALVAAVIAMPGISSAAAVLEGIRVGVHDSKARVVFDLSGSTKYTVQRLENPSRVVVEFPGSTQDHSLARLNLSNTPLPLTAINLNRGSGGGIEVTLALEHAVRIESFPLEPHGERGYRLVVDLYDELATDAPGSAGSAPAAPGTGLAPAVAGSAVEASRRTRSSAAYPPETKPSGPPHRAATTDTSGPNLELSGTWEQEWAYQTKDARNQKFEALVEPRLDAAFAGGSQLVAIGRIRLDAVGDLGPFESRPDNYSEVNGPVYNDEYAELSLRELYLDTEWAGAYWRLGKQQVVWGQADGIKVLDVVNPQSFREFIMDDFDDSRIPLWMVNAEIPLDGGGLQLLWIPDTTYHELAEQGSPYFLTSPKWVPSIPPGTGVKVSSFDKPDDPLADSDLGARYTAFLGGWDISLNYLYHHQDYPVLYQQLDAQGPVDVLEIAPTYKRNNLIGGTLSNAFEALTLRAELAYSTDTYHTTDSWVGRGIENSAEVASVVGLDWQYSGDGLLSAQWFLSYLPDYSQDIVRDESENTMSLLFQQRFANNTWQLRVLGLYSLNDEDSLLELKLKYWLLGNLELWVGGDFFHGTQRGSFGQFDEQSRAVMGLEYGF